MNPENDIFSTLKGKWDFAISIIVIVVFSAFIYHYISQPNKEISNELATETMDIPIVGEKDISENDTINSDPGVFQRSKIKIEDEHDKDAGEAIVITDFEQSVSSASIKVDSVLSTIQKEINTDNQQSDNKISDTTITKAVPQEVHSSMKEEVMEVKNKVELEEPRVINSEKNKEINERKVASEMLECTVVVGVFRVPENTKTVIEKLKALGYEHVEGSMRKGMTYVGVPVSCDNEQKKQNLLTELNKAFGIDSWVKKK